MSFPLVKLCEACDVIAGQSPPSSTYNNISNGLPFFQGKTDFGELYPKVKSWCSSPVKIAEKNDILISVRAPVGPTNLAPSKCCIGRGLSAIRPKDNVDYKYVLHYLRTIENQLAHAGRGSTFSAITQADLRETSIPLPHIEEQRRIAAILDKADGIRRKRREAISILDDLLRSTFLDTFGDPITNPKGFPIGCIGDLFESVNYGTGKKADVSNGAFPVIRMNNITYSGNWNFNSLKYVDLNEKDQLKHLVHNGQMLFNHTNSKKLVGKTAVYRQDEPMAFAGYLVRGIAKIDADAEYIAGYLNSDHGKLTLFSMCKSIVGMANINAKEMQRISILIPPPDLQKKFGDIVRSLEKKKETYIMAEMESNDLFNCLVQKAFSEV